MIGLIVSVALFKGGTAKKITFCDTFLGGLDDKNETVNRGMAGDKIIRFDGRYKRIHFRLE